MTKQIHLDDEGLARFSDEIEDRISQLSARRKSLGWIRFYDALVQRVSNLGADDMAVNAELCAQLAWMHFQALQAAHFVPDSKLRQIAYDIGRRAHEAVQTEAHSGRGGPRTVEVPPKKAGEDDLN